MGKKGYNWQARSVPKIEIERHSAKSIPIEINHRADTYDECNPLVLPSKKRKTIKRDKKYQNIKLLSKKRRKQLEKVVERKEKKLNRATLLENLSKVQATPEELNQYISITSVQTKGLKRQREEDEAGEKPKHVEDINQDESEEIINAIKGSKKQRLKALHQESSSASSVKNSDPNVVGFDDNSSESDYESSDDEKSNNEEVKISEGSPVSPVVENSSKSSSNPLKNASDTLKNTPDTPKTCPTIEQKIIKGKTEIKPQMNNKPAIFVTLNRTKEIQEARLKLPVLAEEQLIVEAINDNPIVIITGETGSGKTTQVPQFLYEAGYAKNKLIGITEPRRVAAISMSKRVAEEMNLSSSEVSYLIRFEGNTTDDTKIKFMTDGVLLKEVQTDFLLSKYSVIILDEAHERSVYTDILIGLLSRIVPMRAKRNDPLKLIIMSATLRVEDFLENPKLFRIKPPLIKVESRQFPVTIHFNRKTSHNYVIDAVKKTVKIHTKLPEGGILIFLTGQHEVNTVVRKLRKVFPYRRKTWDKCNKIKSVDDKNEEKDHSENDEDNSDDDFNQKNALKRLKNKRKSLTIDLPSINLDNYSSIPNDDTQEDLFSDNDDDIDQLDEDEEDDDFVLDLHDVTNSQPLWVLPLYSLLPAYKQARVFEKVPEGCRLCVVSTNVAETSLTIPNVKYVVDSGRCKTRMYDKITGVSTFKVTYTSQAGANQRAGRAGRMGPGHCYRLYSSAVFNDQFEKFAVPEIQRKPVDDLLLQMKVMNIVKVVNFPFPSPPDSTQLKSAEKRLTILGALQNDSKSLTYSSKVTPLGKSISAFPVAPRYGKMLSISQQSNLLNYTICMVSALSVQELLIEGLSSENNNKKKWLQTRRFWAGSGNSLLLGDPMVLIRAVGAAEYSSTQRKLLKFCQDNGLRPKAISEIKKLRNQLTNEINLNIPELRVIIDPNMSPPTETQAYLLRQIILAGMADQVARKMSPDEIKEGEDKSKFKFAYKTIEMEEPVFMHSSCVLRKTAPEWIVYQEIYETNKIYMRGITAIEPQWLPKFVPSLCKMGEPMVEPPPRWDEESGKVMCFMSGTFGRGAWELPAMEVEFPASVEGVRWFARFLLEGKVCGKLKRFIKVLIGSPGSVNKSWAKLLPRNEALTRALLAKGVMSRERLMEVWEGDRGFLLEGYKMWVPESAHGEVCKIWPPV